MSFLPSTVMLRPQLFAMLPAGSSMVNITARFGLAALLALSACDASVVGEACDMVPGDVAISEIMADPIVVTRRSPPILNGERRSVSEPGAGERDLGDDRIHTVRLLCVRDPEMFAEYQ